MRSCGDWAGVAGPQWGSRPGSRDDTSLRSEAVRGLERGLHPSAVLYLTGPLSRGSRASWFTSWASMPGPHGPFRSVCPPWACGGDFWNIMRSDPGQKAPSVLLHTVPMDPPHTPSPTGLRPSPASEGALARGSCSPSSLQSVGLLGLRRTMARLPMLRPLC